MNPVRRRDLLVVAVGLALGSWLVVRSAYGVLPRLEWWLPVPVGVLAVAEAFGARTLRLRLQPRRPVRLVALHVAAPTATVLRAT